MCVVELIERSSSCLGILAVEGKYKYKKVGGGAVQRKLLCIIPDRKSEQYISVGKIGCIGNMHSSEKMCLVVFGHSASGSQVRN